MNKLLGLFLDRVSERLTALLAGLISSRIEGFHSAAQADQQSQLEDLARHYEADGKPEIAATLRQRSARLVSNDLAAEAVQIVHLLTNDSPRSAVDEIRGSAGGASGLPDFSAAPRGRTRRLKPTEGNASADSGVTS